MSESRWKFTSRFFRLEWYEFFLGLCWFNFGKIRLKNSWSRKNLLKLKFFSTLFFTHYFLNFPFKLCGISLIFYIVFLSIPKTISIIHKKKNFKLNYVVWYYVYNFLPSQFKIKKKKKAHGILIHFIHYSGCNHRMFVA